MALKAVGTLCCNHRLNHCPGFRHRTVAFALEEVIDALPLIATTSTSACFLFASSLRMRFIRK